MTNEEIKELKGLAASMGLYDDKNPCKRAVILGKAIKSLEQEPKILNTLDFAIDASNGDTNYFVGFRNGLRYSKSLIDGKEPQFENCTEQEPKTGHWINRHIIANRIFDMIVCSECGEEFSYDAETGISEYNYCPNCGCRMVEPQESERTV